MGKKKKEKDMQTTTTTTTTKKVLYFLLGNGVFWVWCSYILAFLGKDTIAETLSGIAITEILGVFFVYATKSLFENLSKHNSWPDKKKKDTIHENEGPNLSNWDNAKGTD